MTTGARWSVSTVAGAAGSEPCWQRNWIIAARPSQGAARLAKVPSTTVIFSEQNLRGNVFWLLDGPVGLSESYKPRKTPFWATVRHYRFIEFNQMLARCPILTPERSVWHREGLAGPRVIAAGRGPVGCHYPRRPKQGAHGCDNHPVEFRGDWCGTQFSAGGSNGGDREIITCSYR